MQAFHEQFISGTHGELTIIGDVDVEEVKTAVDEFVQKLPAEASYTRIESPAVEITGDFQQIDTPDKENATYFAGAVVPIGDRHPDYPALLIGNDILGGAGALSSRLGDRVRQKDGLSYGVGSMLHPSAHDERTELMFYAISNPDNVPKVRQAIQEEIQRIREEGVTQIELEKAISSYIQSSRVSRTSDASLAGLLEKNADAGRTMSYVQDFEQRVEALTVDAVNDAIRKYIDPAKIFVVVAGDFADE